MSRPNLPLLMLAALLLTGACVAYASADTCGACTSQTVEQCDPDDPHNCSPRGWIHFMGSEPGYGRWRWIGQHMGEYQCFWQHTGCDPSREEAIAALIDAAGDTAKVQALHVNLAPYNVDLERGVIQAIGCDQSVVAQVSLPTGGGMRRAWRFKQ